VHNKCFEKSASGARNLEDLLAGSLPGGTTCGDDFPIPEYKIPIETRLVRYLRAWSRDLNAVVADGRTVMQEICSLLEWYVCECIQYGPGNLREWWSDGVVKLCITQTASEAFKLLVVTWIGSLGRAPFEIDVELNPADNQHFANTVFRIGTLDDHGKPRVFGRRIAEESILEKRPRRDRDWAMAVELTPP
jgi:hypothetical protein